MKKPETLRFGLLIFATCVVRDADNMDYKATSNNPAFGKIEAI